MTSEAIAWTLVSSLMSGIVGVGVSVWVFYKLEKHKLKVELARRLLGNRFNVNGDAFSCAMNEVIAIYSDADDVLQKWSTLMKIVESSGKPGLDGALIDFLKAVCKESRLSQTTLNDTYWLKVFNGRA